MTNQPSESYNKSKRIASNTLVLFVRMFLLTILNLYAVRLVLRGLGEEDYGIFNTIAGVVTLSSFLSGVMALSVQRFYSIALGLGNPKRMNDIFSVSMNILIVLSVILLILFETIGLWFIRTEIHIPPERMHATLWLFQFSLFSFICSIFQIPYTASIFAHEDMGAYAMISTVECILRVVVAWMIGKMIMDGLIFYGFGLVIVAILVLLLYAWYGSNHYEECHYRLVRQSPLYRRLLIFSGWTMFGSVANVGLIQGNIILLGVFFGPIINAAFGIALQINNAFQALCNSMVLPFRSAMMRAFAEKQFDYLDKLFSVSNKFVFYILLAVSLPILSEMVNILHIWLGDDINQDTVLFSRLIIIYIICLAMHNPITIIMQASGYVKEYHLPVESITLMCLPVTYILFRLGMPSYSVFFSMIGVCVIAHVVRLVCLCHYYKRFSILDYIVSFVIPSCVITIMSGLIAYTLHHHISDVYVELFSVILLMPLVVIVLAYLFGINRKEKELTKSFVINFIKRRAA